MSELNAFVETPVETPEPEQPEVEQEVAEVEQPEAEPAQPEAEQPDASPTEADSHKSGHVPLAALLDEREKRREYQKQLEEYEKRLNEIEAQQKPELKEPTLADCDFDEAVFQQKSAEYHAAKFQSQFSREELVAQVRQELIAEQQRAEAEKSYRSFMEKGAQLDPNFQAMVNDDSLSISEPMAEALMGLENGPAVLLGIMNDPAQLTRFASMKGWQQASEVGAMSASMRFAAKPEPKPAPEVPKSLTNVRAAGHNESVVNIPDPLESTFNR